MEKRTLYTNKPAVVPKGHIPINNNLAMPIVFQGEVIGLFNLANKKNGYTEKDREFLEAIAGRIAPVLYAWIQKEMRENEHKRAEEKIAHLASFPEMNPNPIMELDPEGRVTYTNPSMQRQFPDLGMIGTSHPLLSNWSHIKAGFQEQNKSFLFLEAKLNNRVFHQAVYFARRLHLIRIYSTDITERKRAEQSLQQSVRQFELLARTAGELLQTTEPQKIVESLCRRVMEHLDCHAFFNFLVDEKAGRLHLNAYAGIPADEARKVEWLDYGVAVCGCVARDGCRIVAEKIPTTPDERTELVKAYGIKAYACHPILGPAGKVIGTLSFGTCGRETFSEDDLSLMKAVTDQVAVAMIRLRDEQALRQAHDDLEARVKERTAQLARINEELEKEIGVRRETERRVALTNELLKLYTQKYSRKEYLDVAVELIRRWSGCRHTGVRIADAGGSIPYESCVGYNPDFLSTEDRISMKHDDCVCTRIVDASPASWERHSMTPNGSFYSGQTMELVGGLSEEQRKRYRGVCMQYGYRSLAVVPVRHGEKILGAIHLADERPAMVPVSKVEFIEQLAFILGEALFRFGIEEELRQLNRELEQRVADRTAQLESANRELEAFAYSVSHDLRTPLRSIDGFSHAVLEDYKERLDDAGRDFLQRIRTAAGKMGQLIDALLNLSRLTRGDLNRVAVDIGSLARGIAEDLKKFEPHREAQFNIMEGITAEADPVMLRVVLENLLSNAWKFTGKREKAKIEIGAVDNGGKPVYFVRDNGAGFDMAYASKLFSAFQRLHGPNEFPGVGIGFATVQRIVHRHGGKIWAEAEVDKGATVYFTLG